MPRHPSPAQSAASRANGRKSPGPQGDAKRRSCRNSYKTGLRSKTLALEYESDKYADRARLWHGYYQPQSPAAFHMTNELAQATLLAERSHAYRQSELDKQRAAARKEWLRQREAKLDRLSALVLKNPEAAMVGLVTFGLGVHWLGTCLQELIDEVQTQGYLSEDSLQWAARVYGVTPTREKICGDVSIYAVSLYNLGCTPGVKPATIDAWLDPALRPDSLGDKTREELLGDDAEECREQLLAALEFERDQLGSEEERLEREVDRPSLEGVLNRASILTEEAAKRVARSHGESRATFLRSLPLLFKTLDRDAEMGPPEPATGNDQEPAADPTATEAGPRSEAGQKAPVDVAAVAAVLGAEVLPNDPEKPSDVRAQDVEITAPSVDTPASARVRPEGLASPAPTAPETVVAVAVAEARREGAAVAKASAPAALPAGFAAVPLSASRRDRTDLPNDPEKAAADLAQMLKEAAAYAERSLARAEAATAFDTLPEFNPPGVRAGP